MPITIRRLLPDNTLQTVAYQADSLTDAIRYEPTGSVYTVTNTHHKTRVLRFDDHLDRLEESARRANIPLTLHRTALRHALRTLIQSHHTGDVRFRITVDPLSPHALILTLEDFIPPSDNLIKAGVRVITAPNSARHDALTKSTDWMHQRKKLENAMPSGIYDTFLLDSDGYIMEGLSANAYAILDGCLYTAGKGVLQGIAQKIVFEIAPDILPLELQPPHVTQIPHFQEAFLTSSSRGIIPVVEIDGIPIADGTPQPHTLQLRQAYLAWSQTHLQEL